jgi:hypothetical protein
MEKKAVDGIHLNGLSFEEIKCNKYDLQQLFITLYTLYTLTKQVFWP